MLLKLLDADAIVRGSRNSIFHHYIDMYDDKIDIYGICKIMYEVIMNDQLHRSIPIDYQ